METGPTFTLGNQQVDRRLVDATLIASMAESAKNIQAPENVPADAWDALADRVVQNDAVSTEDLQQLQSLGRACYQYHGQLHDEYASGGYQDPAIRAELADVHVFSQGNDRIREALAFSSAATAVAATVGGSFGPTGLLTAYVAYSRISNTSLELLADTLQEIRDGSSPTVVPGNRVELFHHEEIWPQMLEMLDKAIADGEGGKPTTVTAQYYELSNQQIVGKLAQAARAGNKVRVNVDAGRLVAYRGDRVEIDDVPDKLRSILQLSKVRGDVAVSFFPVAKRLGDPNDLMHRKGLGVGNDFLLTGMNANQGSGENIDAGMLVHGPAARRFFQNFKRDCQDSAGASNVDVFGERPLNEFMTGDINIGSRGLIALFDCLHGPDTAGSELPKAKTYAELDEIAKSYGENLSDYVTVPPGTLDELLARGEQFPLTTTGRERFMTVLERTLDATRKPTNLKKLKDIDVPRGYVAGTRPVSIADQPHEREAVMLQAIQDAEEFVYVPAFVMTRTIAGMLVARREELAAEGRDLDIRVVCDPGIYPDGGTPNELGVKFLEDKGIPVRWAILPRSGDHDRKLHAKELLTDKGMFCGSTNFSNKGLRDNWEHSAYVEFDPNDPEKVSQLEKAKAKFLRLWDLESFELNSLEKAREMRSDEQGSKDYSMQVEEARYGVQRGMLRAIDAYENATANFVGEKATALEPEIEALEAKGHDHDTATLLAVEQSMGTEAFFAGLAALPERQALEAMKPTEPPTP